MKSDLRYRATWLAFGYVLVTIVVYLSVTGKPVDMGPEFAFKDKLYHILAYFALMVWFAQIYHRSRARIVIAISFILMGLLMEYIQSFDPNRYAEFGDMAANTAGVAIGFWLTLDTGKYLLARVESLVCGRTQKGSD